MVAVAAALWESPVNIPPPPNGKHRKKHTSGIWDSFKRVVVGRPSAAQEAAEEAVGDALDALESAVEETSAETEKAKKEVKRRATGAYQRPKNP